MAAGDKMYIKASKVNTAFATNTNDYLSIVIEGGSAIASGDVTSVLNPDGNMASLPDYGLACLFKDSTALVDASQLHLLSTLLASRTYFAMFRNCTNLLTAPTLPNGLGVSGLRSMA